MLSAASVRAAEPSRDIGLTPEEIRYIREHPVVTLGAGASFDPLVKRNEDGSYSGFEIDLTNLIAAKTGLEFRFVVNDWAEVVKRAERKELDGLASSVADPGRAKYFNFTDPYVKYTDVAIVRKNNPKGIHCVKDLAGKRAAVMAGNINSLRGVRELGEDVEIVWEPNLHDVIRSVATGRSDFMVLGEPVFYIAAELGLAGAIESAFPTGVSTVLCYSLRKDRPELVSIINKALRSIPVEDMVAIRNKWISGSVWSPRDKDGRIALSDQERHYLSANYSLGVCVRGDQPPISYFSPDGKFSGLVGGFVGLAEEAMGPGVRLLPVRSEDPLKDLLGNRCDLVMLVEEPSRPVPGVSFTSPYLSFPYVVVATADKRFLADFKPEAGQAFAAPRGSTVIPMLRRANPGMDIREVGSVDEGLKGVRDGQYYGLVATSLAVAQLIQDKYITELKIIWQTPYTARFSVATRESPPQLNHIFQKIVGSLPDERKRQIVNEWMAVKYAKGVDYSLAWKIVAGALLLIAVALYWNRKLNRAKGRAEEALASAREAIRANLNFIDMISHEYRSPLSVISSNLDLIEAKMAASNGGDVGKELGRMRNSAQRLLNIFEKSLAKIRMENASVTPEKRLVDIGGIVRTAVGDIRAAYPDHPVGLEQAEGERLEVRGDPDLFNVAVLNILDNGCKYSPPGKPLDVFLAAAKGRVTCTVRDQGAGIREEDLGRIFEKYYRSRNVGTKRGVGVGLYLVKRIVEMHGGEIRVHSKPGEGTTVELSFPPAQAK